MIIIKKYSKKKLIAIILIVIGLFCITYTTIFTFINQTGHSYVINKYEKAVSKLSESKINDIEEKAHKYNKAINNLADTGTYDEETIKGSYDVLQLGDIISYINIPKIDIYLPIYDNASEEVLQVGIAHEKGTSLPVGGNNTNCVLLGHSGLTTDPLFTELNKLKKGDKFFLYTLDKKYYYRVTDINIELPDKVDDYIQIKKNRDMVTLITCTPIGVNTHRLIVQADRTNKESTGNKKALLKEDNSHNKNSYENILNKIILIICGLLIFLFIIFIFIYRRKKKGEKKQ